MKSTLVDSASLARTLYNINSMQILDQPIHAQQKRSAAAFIVSRLNQPGSYGGLFALTDQDRAAGRMLLATGETLSTRASMAHIAGEEACRVLLTLGVESGRIRRALSQATQSFLDFLLIHQAEKPDAGSYCCGTCTVSMWRHISAGGLKISGISTTRRLANGLKRLKACRQDNGRWRAFPFYYTLLALTEMPVGIAREELAFAAPACQRLIGRKAPQSETGPVRRHILERVLSII